MLVSTLSSLLNPGICNPEFIIFLACVPASIPAVCIQKSANITEPTTKNNKYINPCSTLKEENEFVIINLNMSGECINNTKPDAGIFPLNVPSKGCPQDR